MPSLCFVGQIIQRECQKAYPVAPLYFIVFITLARTVFLNLYLATILDKLSSAVFKQKKLYESDFVRYRDVWLQFDSKATGKIPLGSVRLFLKRLGPPLGGPVAQKDFLAW